MKRVFEIEYPNELGEIWMNQDNLMLCINAYCENKDGRIKATDVTGKVVYLSDDQTIPILSDRTLSQVAKGIASIEPPPEWKWIAKAQRDATLKAGFRKVVSI